MEPHFSNFFTSFYTLKINHRLGQWGHVHGQVCLSQIYFTSVIASLFHSNIRAFPPLLTCFLHRPFNVSALSVDFSLSHEGEVTVITHDTFDQSAEAPNLP